MASESVGDLQELRVRLRALISEHMPADFISAFTGNPQDLAATQQFCEVLAAESLLCTAWPAEYGGMDAGPWHQTIVREEMWAHGEPRGPQYMGVNWVGPVIMRHGTAEQKELHLKGISSGTITWCQGFSETEAGSDLASLRTSAVRDGDVYRINGQKVWTSYALIAQWCFLLARTETHSRDKRRGITVFLVPMDSPGILVRPLDSLVGPHHLNEVFFTNVEVPVANVLGSEGGGWPIVMEVLAFERLGIARYAKCDRLLRETREALADRWGEVPGHLRARWARALVRSRQVRMLAYKVVASQEAGAVSPADVAAYRIAVTVLDQEVSEVVMELTGADVLAANGETGLLQRAVEDHWRYALASTVSSGTIEMQRRSLARTLLVAQ
jgi:alkylation response protein AidB-like acyl-CoA dehydrogenase